VFQYEINESIIFGGGEGNWVGDIPPSHKILKEVHAKCVLWLRVSTSIYC